MDDIIAASATHDLGSLPPPGLSDDAKRWIAENAGAIQAWNDWIEQNGLPFEDLRRG